MDDATITTDTFLVSGSGNIAGTVSYSGTTATFTPTASLGYGKTYTATITTGARDLAGNACEADYTWSFTTASETGRGNKDGRNNGNGLCFIATAAYGSPLESHVVHAFTHSPMDTHIANPNHDQISPVVFVTDPDDRY